MFSRKNILGLAFAGLIALQFPVFADDISDMKATLSDTIAKLVQKYEARIVELEAENAALKSKLASLQASGNTAVVASAPIKTTAPAAVTITASTPKTDVYNAVIKQTNASLGTILSENNLPGYSAIGLFEFMEPNAFFISLDDGKNPAGVTAFKTKILYTFDSSLAFTKIGLFDLDYASEKYRTVFGTNPYTKATRTRVTNPNYKGKLFDVVPTVTATGSTATPATPTTPTVNAPTTEVTLAQIKTAYDKTKLLDALKLSDVYIVKNPSDLEVLRIRYRSYYIIGKYDDSLTEIKKIETIQGSAFERTIACDAAVIGKIAKKTDVSTYYSTICKKK